MNLPNSRPTLTTAPIPPNQTPSRRRNSGEVLNGDDGGSTAARNMVQSSFSWYAKGASVLVRAWGFLGYVTGTGYISQSRMPGEKVFLLDSGEE